MLNTELDRIVFVGIVVCILVLIAAHVVAALL